MGDASDNSLDTAYAPSDMLAAFKNIPMSVEGENFTLSINKYRNNSNPPDKGGTQEAMKLKDALIQSGHGVVAAVGGSQAYYDVFSGKGTPENIAKVMYQFMKNSASFIAKNKTRKDPVRKAADWLANQDLSWEETFQNICDEFIGLDCNGFTGNWMARCEPHFKLTCQNSPRQFYQQRKQSRSTVAEIAYWDILIWQDFGHIAVIDGPSDDGDGYFNLCQSAGGGPRMNSFRFRSAGQGLFDFTQRGKGDVGGLVYIISPWAEG